MFIETFISIKVTVRKYKNLIVLFFTGILLSALSIVVFQQFLKMSAQELVESWLKAESTTLQQGNLLTAVSRVQGLVLIGNLVKEIQLKKFENGKWIDLMDFGDIQTRWNERPEKIGEFRWVRSGFFSWTANYVFPSDESITIQFVFYSARSVLVFWLYLGTISFVIMISGFLITMIERQNSVEREVILREAIENLVSDKSIPDLLKWKVPKLIAHWQSFKDLLNRQKDQEAESRAAALVSKISKQVAHDIRSPISVLNLTVGSVEASDENRVLIIGALQRINNIANNLLNPMYAQHEEVEFQNTNSSIVSQKSTVSLKSVISSIVLEKQIEYQHKSIDFIFEDNEPNEAYTSLSTETLSRILSNALNNSADAIEILGKVTVSIRAYNTYNCIVITDNGKGISQEIISQLGKEGASFGKKGGNGLGLHYIKSSVEKIGGSLEIQSRVGFGTMLTLKLPTEPK